MAVTVAPSWLLRAAPSSPGSRRRSEGPGNLVRPRRGWLEPEPASKARRRSPGCGAGVPQLAGRLRVAGRGRADSGALRARWGSHSDEIPVPGQRHQPASAFLLPSQIETEGGGREVEKKKKGNQRGREGEAREVLRPDPLVATSALPGGPAQGAPSAERPHSLSPRWAGASPALRKTRIDQTRKEFFSTANEQEARLPALPSPPPGPPPSPPTPPPTFFSSRPLLRPGRLRAAVGASLGRRRGQAEPAGPGASSAPSHLELPAAAVGTGVRARARGSCSSLFHPSLWWDFFFLQGEGWWPPAN